MHHRLCVLVAVSVAVVLAQGPPRASKMPPTEARTPPEALEKIARRRQNEREAAANAAGCGPIQCPEFPATVLFDVDGAHLPAHSDAWLLSLDRPWVSRVYAIGSTLGDTRFWQARTIAVHPPATSGEVSMQGALQYVLLPFLLSPGDAFVFVGTRAAGVLTKKGARDAEWLASLALCGVEVPLPLENITCARLFTPSRLLTTNDPRKNVVGGANAAAILALDALVATLSPSHDAALLDSLAQKYAGPSGTVESKATIREALQDELALLRSAPPNTRPCSKQHGDGLPESSPHHQHACEESSFPPAFETIPFSDEARRYLDSLVVPPTTTSQESLGGEMAGASPPPPAQQAPPLIEKCDTLEPVEPAAAAVVPVVVQQDSTDSDDDGY